MIVLKKSPINWDPLSVRIVRASQSSDPILMNACPSYVASSRYKLTYLVWHIMVNIYFSRCGYWERSTKSIWTISFFLWRERLIYLHFHLYIPWTFDMCGRIWKIDASLSVWPLGWVFISSNVFWVPMWTLYGVWKYRMSDSLVFCGTQILSSGISSLHWCRLWYSFVCLCQLHVWVR